MEILTYSNKNQKFAQMSSLASFALSPLFLQCLLSWISDLPRGKQYIQQKPRSKGIKQQCRDEIIAFSNSEAFNTGGVLEGTMKMNPANQESYNFLMTSALCFGREVIKNLDKDRLMLQDLDYISLVPVITKSLKSSGSLMGYFKIPSMRKLRDIDQTAEWELSVVNSCVCIANEFDKFTVVEADVLPVHMEAFLKTQELETDEHERELLHVQGPVENGEDDEPSTPQDKVAGTSKRKKTREESNRDQEKKAKAAADRLALSAKNEGFGSLQSSLATLIDGEIAQMGGGERTPIPPSSVHEKELYTMLKNDL